MSDDAPPSSDRRRALRRVACFPGYVERAADDERIIAMISDLAETGTLLLLRNPAFKIGDELRLELHVMLDEKAGMRAANGHVVRMEPLPDDRASLWTHQVGVEFAEKLELSAEEIDSLQKRQLPFGKKK